MVAQAFSAFDANRETVVILVDRTPARATKAAYR